MQAVKRLAVAAALLGLSACGLGLRGSGRVVSDERSVASFSRVEVQGGLKALVDVGPVQHVTVRTDDNLQQHLRTEVKGDTLTIRWDEAQGGDPTELMVTIGAKSLAGVSASGGSELSASHVAGSQFQVEASGGSQVTATGQVTTLQVGASGGSQIDAKNLQADDVTAKGSGGSELSVSAGRSLDASLSGGSRLQAPIRPAHVQQDLSGGSELNFGNQ